MRLLQITASNVWRGHEQQIVYYYEAFNPRIEHQVLICPSQTKLSEIAEEKNFNVHSIPLKSEYSFSWIKKIKQIVREEKIDLILIHSSRAHTLCVISSILSSKKIPLVFFRTLIKDISKRKLSKLKYNYKYLVKLICVSQAVVDALKPSIKNHSRFSIVGSATDLAEFPKKEATGVLHKEFNLKHDTILIGNISAFVPFKDHYTFVDAAKLIKSELSNVKFFLIGTGKLENEIKDYVEKQGLKSDFVFTGFRQDIPEIFPELDLFMFTSKLEPTGGVLLEAYNCHVPIIATNAGGIPEVIVNGKTGILCEKENAKDFAKKALEVLNNKDLKIELIENGFKHLKENFTKEIITDKMYVELEKAYKQNLYN
ncbi:glycosyltransferase family 4 protein [Tamlana crocina]